ncbi:hypothetical protein [Alkalilimnicola ehrlichii]|uniref:hypothetical protein n=1 Tax=Alkalilimnicola ehrlichii TaxID=351052 RepID=UPI003BA01F15
MVEHQQALDARRRGLVGVERDRPVCRLEKVLAAPLAVLGHTTGFVQEQVQQLGRGQPGIGRFPGGGHHLLHELPGYAAVGDQAPDMVGNGIGLAQKHVVVRPREQGQYIVHFAGPVGTVCFLAAHSGWLSFVAMNNVAMNESGLRQGVRRPNQRNPKPVRR